MAAPRILVVDDQPINVQLLKRKLEREGMEVVTASNGQEALTATRETRPDLILLDVMMPDMDGIQVCQQLQADPDTKAIPVIFITARTSKDAKLEGLNVGAVDYITKPIDLDETFARVSTQLRFVQINREMLELQRRLGDSRRTATIGAMTQGIAHNLNNLLGVVIGYIDLVKAYADKPDLVKKNVGHLEDSVNRIVAIIRQLTSIVNQSKPPLAKVDLVRLIEAGAERYQTDYKISQPVMFENNAGEIKIETNSEYFEEALEKVLINAWESYQDTPDEQRHVTIRTEVADGDDGKVLLVHVEDQGKGIDPAIKDHAFEPFISSKHTVGVGMGLTIARHAMRSLGGEVLLRDRPGGGAISTLRHPLERKPKA